MPLYLGIDVGTSGVRTAVIDAAGNEIASAAVKMKAPIQVDGRPCQNANIWWDAVYQCLLKQTSTLQAVGHSMSDIEALAVDGTSGTTVLTDAKLNPLTLGYMYNSSNFDEEAAGIATFAPENSITRGASSGLARLLFLQKQSVADRATFALHQADWIAAKLMNRGGLSDETNVLKMGYDVQNREWPNWFSECGVRTELLPQVRPVGDLFGTISDESAATFGFSSGLDVLAGATDSNAAFLASGASRVGDGVTSLGTTLAIKFLSDQPVADPDRGVYSHRIKNMWLPGGASNTGGGVLLDHFTVEQMTEMEAGLAPARPTGFDYYPLSRPGERFPISDPNLQPRIEPRPTDDAVFFQALLEGIAEIERIGYAALRELGAPKLQRVFTAGGGAMNEKWTKIREAKLGVPISAALSSHASVGAARIAARLI
ncbi:MAG: sugar (pentulose or hexulose) kinase [Pirellulaceae bacterium]|jgi:sugar (pentulose or hexulose) kinase